MAIHTRRARVIAKVPDLVPLQQAPRFQLGRGSAGEVLVELHHAVDGDGIGGGAELLPQTDSINISSCVSMESRLFLWGEGPRRVLAGKVRGDGRSGVEEGESLRRDWQSMGARCQ